MRPPRKLGAIGLDLWRTVTNQHDISDSGGVETLLQVCLAVDRLEEVTTQITREGLTVRTKNGPREHPLLRSELGLRSFVTRNLQRLGINVEPIGNVGRPGKGGWTGE